MDEIKLIVSPNYQNQVPLSIFRSMVRRCSREPLSAEDMPLTFVI